MTTELNEEIKRPIFYFMPEGAVTCNWCGGMIDGKKKDGRIMVHTDQGAFCATCAHKNPSCLSSESSMTQFIREEKREHFLRTYAPSALKKGYKMILDAWKEFLGKSVDLALNQPKWDSGSQIITTQAFPKQPLKDQVLRGRVVGSDGAGYAWIMLDEPHPGYKGYTVMPPSASVMMEYRNSVAEMAGTNSFIKIGYGSAFCLNPVETDEAKTEPMQEKTKKATKKEDVKMKEEITAPQEISLGFFEQFKKDSIEASTRAATKKMSEIARDFAVNLISTRLGSGGATKEAIVLFMQTPFGIALVQSLAGYFLTYGPASIRNDPRAKRLAAEFRISAIQTLIEAGFNVLEAEVMPMIKSALDMLPAVEETATRVVANLPNEESASEDEEEEEMQAEPKRAANG